MFESLPLHPAVVHLPIGILTVIPIVSLFITALYYRGNFPKPAFLVLVLLHAALVGTSYLALETGEDEEHVVENVVSESYIEEHEQRAEAFMVGTVIVFLISFALALPFNVPLKPTLALLLIGQFVLLGLGYRVGHSGGELVYVHGAAQAYTPDSAIQNTKQKNESYYEHHEKDDNE